METLNYLGQGFGVAMTPTNLITALIGTLIGTIVGLLPGLGPINGVALLIPVAFALGLPPETALILLAAVYLGCEYGGRISSILLNIPGEASTVVLVLGLFSVSEILLLLEKTHHGQEAVKATGRMLFNFKEAASVFLVNLRCGLLGFVMGVLPGAGATLASAVAYMTEKKLAGAKGEFGKGDMRGLAAPETAIGASACGAMVPMLTLGVPGSGTTAVMIGALTLYNITPGPLLFQQQPDIVWGLIASLFIANVMLIILNVPMVRVFTRILAVPNWALVPAIAIITGIGVYGVHATTFDLFLMVGIGVIGYILRKLDFPLSPLLLGFILGGLMEQNLRRALSISNGELGILWSSPISLVTWALVVVMLLLPLVRAWRRRVARRATGLADA
ncbi:tripartite tricarboxylate transporter permease [Pseudomonas aeruginosa]|uniref:tripartite tricarboxylate transporter permease n=1 Tax=Pseudomonas aeruginosa TaxID=287 RepID=UPI00104694E9|nr:tripartite tricarboxylate transporter permease [Pseudomonas aeruginosa]